MSPYLASTRPSPDPAPVLREVMEAELGQQRPNEPGVAAGVYVDGRLVASHTQGLACLEHDVPIGRHTVFDLASVSKQMTATAAVLAARDGLVDLDADVRELVPELRLPGVSLRHCLQHTSGLNDYMDLTELAGLPLGAIADTADFLTCLSRMVTPVFDPGTDIRYSNTGYVLAAAVLARATGQSFGSLMDERVFQPLDMQHTRLHDELGVVAPQLAFSYVPRPGGGFAREEMVEAQVGDGAVLTTLDDLAGWHGFLLDGRVLGAGVRETLLTRSTLADGRRNGYALGIQHRRFGDVDAVMHGGAMYGYRSGIASLPSLGIGVAVLANRGDVAASQIVNRLVAALSGTSVAPVAERSFADEHAGTWIGAGGTACVRLVPGAGEVRVEPGGDVLRPADDGWTDAYDDVVLTMDGSTATLTDRMGHRTSLRRPVGALPDTRSLIGAYELPDLGTRARVRSVGDTVALELDHQASRELHPVAVEDGIAVFRVGDDGIMTAEEAHPDGATLRLWDGRLVLRRVDRRDAT